MGRTQRRRAKKKHFNKSPSSLDHEESLINLRKFLSKQGFKNETSLKLYDFPQTGRGVSTKKSLKKNDILIKIPFNLMITFTTIIKNINFNNYFKPKTKLNIHELLTFYLILERHNPQSKWRPYISVLPETPPWLPQFLTDEQIGRLPLDLRLQTLKSRDSFESSWLRLKQSILKDRKCVHCDKRLDCVFDLNSFTWGYILVNTRAVYVNPEIIRELSDHEILSDEPCMALCPYLDMFNHNFNTDTKAELIKCHDELFFQLITLSQSKKHEQVFISYGAHDNVKLFTEYGFFIPGNTYDSIQFESTEVLKVLELVLSSFQFKFIREHCLDCFSKLYFCETGASFHLKAFLFVCHYCDIKDYACFIYGGSYCQNFELFVENCCKKLLIFRLNCEIESLDKLSGLNCVLFQFLTYRIDYLKSLIAAL